ncbi:hypothetical protein [Candidatus Odyssella acanthamoebae]|nr:hypothetical protein [Candidatus Paracaedibacter acanthamoebae]
MERKLRKILFFVAMSGLSICLQGCTDSYNLELDDSINKAASHHNCSPN